MEDRKWLPTFSELIDRLAIHQLKEVFIPENKKQYSKEIDEIVHDIEIIIKEKDIQFSGEMVQAIVILAQINAHIWYNETKVRGGSDQDLHLLKLTHGLNGIRNNTSNYISSLIGSGERMDWKTDCLAAEFKDWEISLFKDKSQGEKKE